MLKLQDNYILPIHMFRQWNSIVISSLDIHIYVDVYITRCIYVFHFSFSSLVVHLFEIYLNFQQAEYELSRGRSTRNKLNKETEYANNSIKKFSKFA